MSAPSGLDAELLIFLGFDPAEIDWWEGRQSWPSPLRTLVVDLDARGVTTAAELTPLDERRLRVADQVSDVQEGHRRPFVTATGPRYR